MDKIKMSKIQKKKKVFSKKYEKNFSEHLVGFYKKWKNKFVTIKKSARVFEQINGDFLLSLNGNKNPKKNPTLLLHQNT